MKSNKTKHILVIFQWLASALIGWSLLPNGESLAWILIFPFPNHITILMIGGVGILIVFNILISILIYKGKGLFTQERV